MGDTRNVVIPAGGVIPEEYARALGTPFRALAPLGPERRPVMQMVVDALRDSGAVGRVVGVAAEPVQTLIRGVDVWLTAGDGGPDNIRRGLAALPDAGTPALVCTSDLPLLTPQAVADFAARCDGGADVSFALVRASEYEAAFPDAPPSEWVTLRDAGPVTLGGLFGIRPDFLQRQEIMLARVFESRKHQWRMARLLGPRLLWQWATHTLTLPTLVARGETILGGRAQVVRDAAPCLAFDIDNADDYTYADTRIRQRRRDGPARPL